MFACWSVWESWQAMQVFFLALAGGLNVTKYNSHNSAQLTQLTQISATHTTFQSVPTSPDVFVSPTLLFHLFFFTPILTMFACWSDELELFKLPCTIHTIKRNSCNFRELTQVHGRPCLNHIFHTRYSFPFPSFLFWQCLPVGQISTHIPRRPCFHHISCNIFHPLSASFILTMFVCWSDELEWCQKKTLCHPKAYFYATMHNSNNFPERTHIPRRPSFHHISKYIFSSLFHSYLGNVCLVSRWVGVVLPCTTHNFPRGYPHP